MKPLILIALVLIVSWFLFASYTTLRRSSGAELLLWIGAVFATMVVLVSISSSDPKTTGRYPQATGLFPQVVSCVPEHEPLRHTGPNWQPTLEDNRLAPTEQTILSNHVC